ncbi:MAG: sensor domain-containing diguanylate cyclase [Deltaproteobacteria bacterium]|nr:sensor domain-containing diguanylate cyclase [Deltaproteobacteria bacterium]
MDDTRQGTLDVVTQLARELRRPYTMEELLQLIVDSAARAVGATRASLRIMDPSATRLVAICRSGEPLHLDPDARFKVGEGLVGWIVEHAEPLRTGHAEDDERFAERDGRRDRVGSFLGAPIVSGSLRLGALCALHPEPDRFTREHEELLVLICAMCAPVVEEQRFSHLTTMDPLTSALTCKGLAVALPDSRLSSGGRQMPVSVVMVDMDRFGSLNREYGSVVGDQVLREVAKVLASILGAGDAVVRYGGEEFLLILPGVDREAACGIAEEARHGVKASSLRYQSTRIQVTASFGVAERRPGESRSDLIRRADKALLTAKRSGRDRVVPAD